MLQVLFFLARRFSFRRRFGGLRLLIGIPLVKTRMAVQRSAIVDAVEKSVPAINGFSAFDARSDRFHRLWPPFYQWQCLFLAYHFSRRKWHADCLFLVRLPRGSILTLPFGNDTINKKSRDSRMGRSNPNPRPAEREASRLQASRRWTGERHPGERTGNPGRKHDRRRRQMAAGIERRGQ